MRGAASTGMAAAIATLDLADGFDSVCGSSAGGRGGGGAGDISGRLSWYRRAWDLFGRVPRWLLGRTSDNDNDDGAASSTTATADVRPPPLPGEDGNTSLLPGTSAMYGLGRFRRTK